MAAKGGPGKLGGFTSQGTLQGPTSKAFYGSRSTRAAKAAGTGANAKMPLTKGFRANHLTARPRALGRYNSLAMFNAAEKTPFYSPFQMAANYGGKQAAKSSAFRTAVYGSDAALAADTQVFQRGMISMMTAGRKTDMLEKRAIGGSSRAARKVATAQEQVSRLAGMNNPAMLQGKSTIQVAAGMRNAPIGSAMQAQSPAQRLAAARAAGPQATMSPMAKALSGGPQVGLTGNLMASSGATQASRLMQGYFRGALGHAGSAGLTGEALTGANRAVSHLAMALDKTGKAGLGIDNATGKLTGRFASVYEAKAAKALGQGAFKTLGVKGVAQAMGTKTGAMALGARAGMMAIPGLNLIATASLVYDLGKMGGEVIKSGINLAKDAVKSMKGSIDKPMFGMGYKDNEVAATSRARGVAAIQNSRLNARSALGSEGAMMASHFG
jgi:hypothetical protein